MENIKTVLEKYFSLLNGDATHYVKFKKDGENMKLSSVVLSGCFRQWKVNGDIIYVPGFNICGEREELHEFLKPYTTVEIIKYALDHAFTSKLEYFTKMTKYSFKKDKDKLTIEKDEMFNSEEFFKSNSKNKKVSKDPNVLQKELLKAFEFISSKTKDKEKDKSKPKEKVEKNIINDKVQGLTEDQRLNVTEYKLTGIGTKIEKQFLKDGKTSKIKESAVYITPKIFYYKSEDGSIPESVVNFCCKFFNESKDEATSRLEAL